MNVNAQLKLCTRRNYQHNQLTTELYTVHETILWANAMLLQNFKFGYALPQS